ncbi:MAG: phage minor capsid protein [Ethanoligenens sp.]
MLRDYDLQGILQDMEDAIIQSYRRNMAAHTVEEIDAGFTWQPWQLIKLQDLKKFNTDVAKLVKKYHLQSTAAAREAILEAFRQGAGSTDGLAELLGVDMAGDGDGFFAANQSLIEALQMSIGYDLNTASSAVLRMTNDVFRGTIYKAQTFYAAGASNLWQAVDMASKDFLDRGLNCIEYSNGRRVNIASYAEMALRASKKKAYMTGEARRAGLYGTMLCQITQYSGCSPTCRPWQGRVYVDDVYAGGQPDGKHRLLSVAIDGGLFHPNCRHAKQPYWQGISQPLELLDQDEMAENYDAEQRQREIERNIRKFKRRAMGSLDPADVDKAQDKVAQWQQEMRDHLQDNPQLRRNAAREKLYA